MATKFEVGRTYTRPEVAQAINMPEVRRKGNWHTGYDKWEDEFLIFANVGTPGRTGHDYLNRWHGNHLIWYGKGWTTASQPEVQELLSGSLPVHLFWRGKDRSPFTYAGLAIPVGVRSSTPVEITWQFDAEPMQLTQTGAMPTWRRGPPPSTGDVVISRESGPVSVYLFTLEGADTPTFPGKPDGMMVVKIGISNDPERRLAELNWGFPPGCSLRWREFHTKSYKDGLTAFEAEGRLLDVARIEGRWLGGEYVYATPELLSELLRD
ncbi:DUF3427 domain-containing protein [Novosphingobium sp. RL4]|uniref:DUF3427 domain-containing protein n=1 Tax=Novosphingobium sp. RL4 TaxID=3109595 RepID=UPI002D79CA97|nr:DUF3427 domain-containing protein [Novosphingobium sp. RL4]WRT93492.1 DUF3427 domain-containing protein [Novosphingobium sp. RL4]